MFESLVLLLAAGAVPDHEPLQPASSEPRPIAIDRLPAFDQYKIDPYLDAAIQLQLLGKEKAVKELLSQLARLQDGYIKGNRDADRKGDGARVILLSRLLFRSANSKPCRPPRLGAPFNLGASLDGVWPDSPFEIVDGVPFLIVQGYALGGRPERAVDYLDYLSKHCVWRASKYSAKSAEEKMKACEKLLASGKWTKPIGEADRLFLLAQLK